MIRGSCLCGGMKYEIDGDLSGPFCSICGSTLVTISSVNPDMIGLSLGTLDDDPGIRPTMHVFVGSKAPWHEISDDLPQYE